MMSSPASLTAGLCCICFDRLSPPVTDINGVRWDVCAGACSLDAGILEWNLLTAAGRSTDYPIGTP